jgi:hypothetical protein
VTAHLTSIKILNYVTDFFLFLYKYTIDICVSIHMSIRFQVAVYDGFWSLIDSLNLCTRKLLKTIFTLHMIIFMSRPKWQSCSSRWVLQYWLLGHLIKIECWKGMAMRRAFPSLKSRLRNFFIFLKKFLSLDFPKSYTKLQLWDQITWQGMIFTWNSNWLACSILPGLSTHIKIMSIMWAMLEIFWKNRKKKKKVAFLKNSRK